VTDSSHVDLATMINMNSSSSMSSFYLISSLISTATANLMMVTSIWTITTTLMRPVMISKTVLIITRLIKISSKPASMLIFLNSNA